MVGLTTQGKIRNHCSAAESSGFGTKKFSPDKDAIQIAYKISLDFHYFAFWPIAEIVDV